MQNQSLLGQIIEVTIEINVSICTRNGHLKDLLKLCLQSKIIINLLSTKKDIGGCTGSSWPNRVVMVIINEWNVFGSKRVKSISKLEEPKVSQENITNN